MTEPIISVKNLGKSYLIRHKDGDRGNETLREVITHGVVRLGTKLFPNGRKPSAEAESGGKALPSKERFWALRNVSFEVQQGEVVGIIGRNGAGKSTLLKVLSRITEPTEGRVDLRGRVASLLEVGTGFHPELSGRQNIYLNGAILGMSRAEVRSKFDEIIAFAEIDKFLDTPVKRYSSGMYVRLAFAVAAHLDPEILIVDEVLAVGDIGFQKKCLGKMSQVSQEGRTVLFVSHNLGAIERLCRRAIYLSHGQIVMDGLVDSVCEKYIGSAGLTGTQKRLEDWPRTGNGKARFVGLTVFDHSGNEAHSVRSGEAIRIELEVEANQNVDHAVTGFALLMENGTRVFNASSLDSGSKIGVLVGTSKVQLEFGGIHLSPGSYLCNLSLTDSVGRTIDYVVEFPLIEVLSGPALPNKRNYNQRTGPIFVPTVWTQVP